MPQPVDDGATTPEDLWSAVWRLYSVSSLLCEGRESRRLKLARLTCQLGSQASVRSLSKVFPVSAHGTDSGLSFKECFGLVV
jgi:hypothetical protein